MKWPYTVVLAVAIAGMMMGANKIASITKISEESTTVTGISNFEKSPDKLKKLISAHRAFHKKVKIVFASLIEELEPHIEYGDAEELKEIVETILDQYNDRINKADEALKKSDIMLTNALLARAAKELKNIYIAHTTLLELKLLMEPRPQTPKHEIIKSASIPGKQTPGMFFDRGLAPPLKSA